MEALVMAVRVLITGGTGTIGSAIAARFKALFPKRVIVLSNDEDGLYRARNALSGDFYEYMYADVRDKARMEEAVRNADVVFHCAALKHVPACEENPLDAVKTNIMGTANVIEACKKHGAEFILISTDKAVYPISTMGQTKSLAERLTISAGFKVVRFGNVLRSRGSVIPFWESQAQAGENVTITDKRMMRYFMSIDEAVDLILWTWEKGTPGCIHIKDMEEMSIYDLAIEIAAEYGVEVVESGIRPGEKLREALMTEEEKLRSSISGGYIVVKP